MKCFDVLYHICQVAERVTKVDPGVCIWDPHLGGGESAMVPLERAMVVSFRLSIVTIALSQTVRTQFAVECWRHSNQQGVGHFGAKCGKEPKF